MSTTRKTNETGTTNETQDGQPKPSPTPQTRRAAVVGANRIPFGKAGGAYSSASNLDMLTAALSGLVARYGLAGERLGEVTAGAVLKHSRDFNLTREAVLGASLSPQTPASDVQRACATSLEATWDIANKIALGQIESGIAGGADSTSDAPIVVSDRLRRTLLKLARAKSLRQRLALLAGLRPGDLTPVAPDVAEPRTGMSMGEHQALTAREWGITRQAQDEIALASHHNLVAAYERGFFDDLLTPYRGLTRDESLRADTSAEKLAKLKPVFGLKGSEGSAAATMTAGNSTPLSDGAAAVLLASDSWAAEHGLPVLAHIVDAEAAAVDFVRGEDGLLMAGAYAMPRLLHRTGLSLDDFAFIEIHEAFASTVLTTTAAWADEDWSQRKLGLPAIGEIDRSRLNVVGSSLATGHPFAATGTRVVGTLAKLLADRKAEQGDAPVRGLISVCAAGGQAVAMILEA